MARQFSLRFILFLFFSDVFLAVLALHLATEARYTWSLGRALGEHLGQGIPLPLYGLTVVIWTIIFLLLNVYNPREITSLGKELVKVSEAALLAWLVLDGVLYFTYRDISRLLVVYFLAFDVLLVLLHRVVLRVGFSKRNGHRYHVRHVLIVGTGEIAASMAALVTEHAWMGLALRGFAGAPVDENSTVQPVLGRIEDTFELITTHAIDEVLIALPRDESAEVRELIYRLQTLPVNIRLVPDYFDMVFLRLDFENFSGMPLLSLKEPVLDPFQRMIKRVFDVLVGLAFSVPALPLMGLIALAIRLDSPGPALFKQQRVGEGGKLFTMLKFRTMYEGAEHLQADYNTVDDDGNVIHKHEDDPRVTRVGALLRRTSLDELPQLLNILRGDMSLVGPRPEMPWLVDMYKTWQRKRFEVPQGLTGWWQINGRSDKPMHLHTEDDLYYIQHYSLLLDVKILLRTFGAVFRRKGAF